MKIITRSSFHSPSVLRVASSHLINALHFESGRFSACRAQSPRSRSSFFGSSPISSNKRVADPMASPSSSSYDSSSAHSSSYSSYSFCILRALVPNVAAESDLPMPLNVCSCFSSVLRKAAGDENIRFFNIFMTNVMAMALGFFFSPSFGLKNSSSDLRYFSRFSYALRSPSVYSTKMGSTLRILKRFSPSLTISDLSRRTIMASSCF